jgi:tetratricopeptide (TPR) repeat protein
METPANHENAGNRKATIAIVVSLFALGVFVGWPSLAGAFLSGDDIHLVLNHVLVNHPSLTHAWELITIVHRDLYQPVPLLSFSLDFAIIRALGLTPEAEGANAGAWVFHLTNVLIHAASGVLVFWLLSRISRKPAVGVVAAVVFLVHPFGAEVVAWLNGRMMLLATLFALAALISLDSYLLKPRWWKVVLVLAFVVLTMCSKIRVGLPVLMVILPLARHAWPSRKWWAVWAASGVVTAAFVAFAVVTTATSEMFEGAAETMQGSRIARTVLVLAWYLQHYLVPVNMSPWHPPEPLVLWSHPGIPWAIGLLLLVAALAVWSWRYSRVGVLGLLWFLATVASTLPLVPSRDVMAADRYVYLPNIGLHWIVAAAAVAAVAWMVRRTGKRAVVGATAMVGVAAAVAISIYTWRVESYYVSDLAKARRIAALYPEEEGVWQAIGWAHFRKEEYTEAIEVSQRDADLHPDTQACEVYQLIGMSQVRLGRVEEGLQTLYRAMEADPEYGKVYARLGQVYYEELGDYQKAKEHLQRAVELMPEYLPSVKVLGHTYRKLNQVDKAVQTFKRALEINEFDPVATNNLAELEMQQGKLDSAIQRFKGLLDWMPENTVARTNLGVCYFESGDLQAAERQYETALRNDPRAVTAAINLAKIQVSQGAIGAAARVLETALGHSPGDRVLLVATHDMLESVGQLRNAALMWTQAIRLEPKAADLAAWYAWTSALASQPALARQAAQQALSQDAGQALAVAALVVIDITAGDFEQADRHLDTMLALPDSQPFDPRGRLQHALAQMGSQNPEDPWPYYFVARLLKASGQPEAAKMGVEEFTNRISDPVWVERAGKLLSDTNPAG